MIGPGCHGNDKSCINCVFFLLENNEVIYCLYYLLLLLYILLQFKKNHFTIEIKCTYIFSDLDNGKRALRLNIEFALHFISSREK